MKSRGSKNQEKYFCISLEFQLMSELLQKDKLTERR